VTEAVKRPGPPRRSAKVVETRRRILDAAQELFLTRGYGSTTIEAIAEAAGVSVPTVYVRFENKRFLLQALLDRTIAGDDAPVPMLDRPWMQEALSRPDTADVLGRIVHESRRIHERTVALVIAVRAAAGTDADLQSLWDTLREQRLAVCDVVARSVRRRGGVRALTRRQARDVLYAALSPDGYQVLVVERGWTPREWEQWTTELLIDQFSRGNQ
jgi:AcrR family transcriptional regulator